MKRTLTLFVFLAVLCLSATAQRKTVSMNADWTFRFGYQFDKNAGVKVQLPHTWNNLDGTDGRLHYFRGIGNYTKKMVIPKEWEGKRVFIRFEGANSVCDFFLNGLHVGEHRGGYTAFVFDLTDRLEYGKENEFLARVNNAEQTDVMPLVGDFNISGGLYRDVYLIITDKACISPTDFASPGVYFEQTNVTKESADIKVRTMLSNSGAVQRNLTLKVDLKDGAKTVISKQVALSLAPKAENKEQSVSLSLRKPRLWNSVDDPFQYQVEVSLLDQGTAIDQVSQMVGLRHFSIDANDGFFLNGKHVAIHGVCRHQERQGVANALQRQHHEEDVALMTEMGVNALRGSHYPHATYFYDLLDQSGIITWAEIPFVGPGGYADKGFIDKESFKQGGRQVLNELIHQQYNHPSIVMWGLFNELNSRGDKPLEYIRELNDLAHKLDPSRYTTSASNLDEDEINHVTDLIAFNRYNGWYGEEFSPMETFLDSYHKTYPNEKIAISEYGAGASIYQQQDTLIQSVPNSMWHPENWQTYYHIQNWKMFKNRTFVWGTFIWNMFDFAAAHRTEGDRYGINDKGLVTHDRKVRKDAYYFYQANWTTKPMVYIEGRRNDQRTRKKTQVMVFSNCPEVILYLNGKEIGRQKPDDEKICRFDITLQEGSNQLRATAQKGVEDSCTWFL